MPETMINPQTPVDNTSNGVQAEATQKPATQESIITRASKVSLTPEQPQNPATSNGTTDSIAFNVKDIERISDPVARKYAEDAYKSFQADYTRKTQGLKDKEKQLESQIASMNSWTPERLQAELNSPTSPLYQAAVELNRRINGTQAASAAGNNTELTPEEYSYLSPEQQKLYDQTKRMEKMLAVTSQQLQSAEIEKQDMSLKQKYANYDPNAVNEIYQGMMSGKIQATREHLWKVQDYDSAVQRAYQLGFQDRNGNLQEKLNANPLTNGNGASVVPSGDTPARNPNESSGEYFKRLASLNIKKAGGAVQRLFQ